MQFPTLSHHGAIRGVTGSCHQLHLDSATSLLIDCGLEQGGDAALKGESASLGFAIDGIQALIVTHVHRPRRAYSRLARRRLPRPDHLQRALCALVTFGAGRCL